MAAIAAIASETWFRGFVHGRFLFSGRVQRVGGPWLVSRASFVSASLYTLTCLAMALAWRSSQLTPFPGQGLELAVTGVCAFVGGLALGVIRERSLSLWPGVAIQLVGGLAGAALASSLL